MIARRLWAGVVIGVLPVASALAQTTVPAADVAELQSRLEEQEQKSEPPAIHPETQS